MADGGRVEEKRFNISLFTIILEEDARLSSSIKAFHRTEPWYAHYSSYPIASLHQTFIPL